MEAKWYAVYTKPRWEKKVAELCSKRKIESYCPLNMMVKQWSDRKKIVWEPLFTSYVFIRVTEKQHSEVKKITGVINLVYWLNKPAVIRDNEIEAIKGFLEEHKSIRLEKAMVNLNDTIRVLNGPLAEFEGNVVAVKNNTVKIVLPSLGYMMVAEVQKSNVEVITNSSFLPVNGYTHRYAFK